MNWRFGRFDEDFSGLGSGGRLAKRTPGEFVADDDPGGLVVWFRARLCLLVDCHVSPFLFGLESKRRKPSSSLIVWSS